MMPSKSNRPARGGGAGVPTRAALILATLLLAGCGGRLAVSAPDDPVHLRLSFEPGQVDRYRTEARGVLVFGAGPTPIGVRAEAVSEVSHRAVSIDEVHAEGRLEAETERTG